MPRPRLFATLALAAVVACNSASEPTADPRALVLGTWYISSCSVVSLRDPTLTAQCGPAHPTRLDVDASYAFVTTPLPPGADSLLSGRGRFLLELGQIKLAWENFPPSGTVGVLPDNQVMTWSATADVYFENPHRLLPAVSTIIWARSAP